MEDTKIDFTQMMRFLNTNMHKDGTVLILGARAGGFFRSQNFYNTMRVFGNPSFSQMPRMKQFGECYKLLIDSRLFTSDGVDTILIASLNDVDIIDADTYVAKLLK